MGCGTNRMFAGLCTAMGREDLIEDPRFKTNLDRCENYLKDLKPIIEEWTKTKTVAELEEIICGLSIPFGPILTIPEISEHSLIKERNMLWDVYQPGMEKTIRIPGSPIKIHGTEDKAQKGAPILGEDNVAIYTEVLGISSEEVKALEENDVI
ncbi:Acetyl-CoA:oxalate CoA-transferase [bioreactor metagenome]|uniref:Acetyl-CoA:oxalate CoA-transferase n=1 Tax=bioreactor metagenome TaxID=1076179 RepID=A0A645GWG0_9ZZZZ